MLPASHNYIFDGAWFCKCSLPVVWHMPGVEGSVTVGWWWAHGTQGYWSSAESGHPVLQTPLPPFMNPTDHTRIPLSVTVILTIFIFFCKPEPVKLLDKLFLCLYICTVCITTYKILLSCAVGPSQGGLCVIAAYIVASFPVSVHGLGMRSPTI